MGRTRRLNAIRIRPATEQDARAIRRLIYAADINPTGLNWSRFLVAIDGKAQVIGCGQIKPHTGGIRELASIAVTPTCRQRGIARAIIEELLAGAKRPVFLMCRSGLVPLYEKFKFVVLAYDDMPRYFQRVTRMSSVVEYLAQSGERLAVMKLE